MTKRETRLWIVDSDDIGETGEGVLYETKPIADFLRPDSTSRFLLVASKGYGKTLLLRAKRDRLERDREGVHLLPENQLTDKPIGHVRVFSNADVARISNESDFWQTCWSIAIAVAITKFAKAKSKELVPLEETSFSSDELARLFSNENLRTITDHFPAILKLNPTEYHKARTDFTEVIGPVYRHLHVPIASFVDNVDQYFDKHLDRNGAGAAGGALEKGFWYRAQTGLASAIRDLHGHNKHVKVFASIRKEAYQRLMSEEQKALQFEGSSVNLLYGPEDLERIFLQNLEAEPDENCVEPGQLDDPFERFFGADNMQMWHPHVGEPESIWDYVLRHTLGRPRDLMSIGAGLSQVGGEFRTREQVRRTVNAVSSTIGKAYLNEIRPHLPRPIDFERLFRLIARNILPKGEVEAVSRKYNREIHGRDVDPRSDEYVQVFSGLYRAGLLGYVARDTGTTEPMQKFESAGNLPLIGDTVLPPSDVYVIHPVLDAVIGMLSPSYSNGFDTLNIAGACRPWRDESCRKGVLVADLVGYSRIMADPALALVFQGDVQRILDDCCERIDHYEVEKGDTLTLIDRNPVNLRDAVLRVAGRLRASDYAAELRVGADFGVLVDAVGGAGGLVGMPLRTAARLEPHAKVDTMAMTAEFVEAVREIDPGFRCEEVKGHLGDLRREGGLFDLRKSDSDPQTLRKLHVVSLQS